MGITASVLGHNENNEHNGMLAFSTHSLSEADHSTVNASERQTDHIVTFDNLTDQPDNRVTYHDTNHPDAQNNTENLANIFLPLTARDNASAQPQWLTETTTIKKLIAVVLKLHLKKKNLTKVFKHLSQSNVNLNYMRIASEATLACKNLNGEELFNKLKALWEISTELTVGNLLAHLEFCKFSLKAYQDSMARNQSIVFVNTEEDFIRDIWCDCTCSSKMFSQEFAKSEACRELIRELQFRHSIEENLNWKSFNSTIFTIINLAQNTVNSRRLKEMKVIDVLQKFLTFQKHPEVRKLVLLALPLLIDKTDADILTANDSIDIINILKMAHETWECKNHTHEGFSIIEILNVLHNLCKNDKIKNIFINNNILDFLNDILQNGVSEQKNIAALILLELAFNPESRIKIKENKKLVEVLRKITAKKEYHDNVLISVLIQVLYLIGATENPDDSPIKGHVMISYCHANKDIVEKVVNTLQEKNLTIWFDTRDMAKGNGDIYDTMAKAVQNAKVVVIFMSEAYNNSENCKFEAEYAARLKKKKIFVKVQEKFVPMDWLGLLAGNNLYHDFAGKVPHNQVMNNLIAAILYEYNQVL